MLTRVGRRPTATLSIPVPFTARFVVLSFDRLHLDMLVLTSSGRIDRIGQLATRGYVWPTAAPEDSDIEYLLKSAINELCGLCSSCVF